MKLKTRLTFGQFGFDQFGHRHITYFCLVLVGLAFRAYQGSLYNYFKQH